MKLTLRVRVLNFFRRVWMIPALERWLSRQTNGRPANSLLCKFVPNPYQYRAESLRQFEKDGIRLVVDVSDYIGHFLYFGFTDPGTDRLFNLCRENYNVLDVGANIGWTSLRLARAAHKGQVIGFEPDPLNASRCLMNVQLNDPPNLDILTVGLGESDGEILLETRTPSNRGGNRVAPAGYAGGGQKIPVRRLDHVEPVLKLGRIDLFKVDVEGYELKVLKGAGEVLTRSKPLLFIEVDDQNLKDQGDSAVALINYLQKLGYSRFNRAENNSPVRLDEDFSNCHFDMIALA